MTAAFLPECSPLLDECIALAKDWEPIPAEEQEHLAAPGSPQERGVRLGELWEPDFLFLKRNESARFQLVGGCVCSPSSWNFAEKVGHPMEFIHGPVPGLNAELGRSIDSFLAKLAPGAAWLRHNWGLSRSRELNQHPSRNLPRLDDSVTEQEVWLRVEHQALVALPRSGGILFGIRIALHSLAEVKRDATAAERLARALDTMPTEAAAYKGLAMARKRIIDLLSPSPRGRGPG
jgi:hypothetical protein